MIFYLTIALIGLVSVCGLYGGWNRDALRMAAWGTREESVREYTSKKLIRLGLLICLMVVVAAAYFIGIGVLGETYSKWGAAHMMVAVLVTPFAGLVLLVLWWLGELLGFAFRRLMRGGGAIRASP